MSGIIFLVPLHPDDAARLMSFSERSGMDPDTIIALSIHKYLDRQSAGIEIPPARGARLLSSNLKEQTK